jgi:hypothetical protein
MQLTRTNAVFSRTVLVSRFCAEIQLSGKSSEFMQKVLFSQNIGGARRASQVGARGPHTLGRRGPGGARAALVCGGLGWPPTPSFGLLIAFDLKTHGEKSKSPETLQNAATSRNSVAGARSLRSGTPPGRGIGGDHRHHHRQRLSIDQPCFPHPCVSNSPAVGRRGW